MRRESENRERRENRHIERGRRGKREEEDGESKSQQERERERLTTLTKVNNVAIIIKQECINGVPSDNSWVFKVLQSQALMLKHSDREEELLYGVFSIFAKSNVIGH